jgi:hypothetical protein
MKDAQGHGSEGRGGGSDKNLPNKMRLTRSWEAHHQTGSALAPHGSMSIAEQHGIATQHLNSSGHEWGSNAAIRDFTREHGAPRDHAAEQRSFNSGKREINRLRRQGK